MSFGRFLSNKINSLLKSTGSYLRYSDNEFKDRKYKNIDIQNEFKKWEEYRKNKNLILKKLRIQKEKLKIESMFKIHQILLKVEKEMKENNVDMNLLTHSKYNSIWKEFDKEKLEKFIKNEEIKKLSSYKELDNFLKKNDIEKINYTNNSDIDKLEYEVELHQINDNLLELEKEIKLIKDEQKELKDDMIILDTFNRDLVWCKFKYYILQTKDFKNFEIHPEDIKTIEKLNYALNNNLPVNKFELFKTVPELFSYEINYLSHDKQKYIEQNKMQVLPVKESRLSFYNTNALDDDDFYTKITKKEYQMEEYFYNETVIFSEKFNDLIEERSKYFGLNLYDYFDYLEYKNEELLEETDRTIKIEVNKVNLIFEDYLKLLEVNKEILEEYKYTSSIPKYILKNPKLIEIWNKTVEKAKSKMYNIENTQLLPHNAAPMTPPIEDEVKQKIGLDLKELERANTNEYFDNLDRLLNKYKQWGDENEEKLYEENLKFKEEKKIQTSKIWGEAMNELYDTDKMDEFNEISLSGDSYNTLQLKNLEKPKFGNFLNEEFNKALYLNNQNPKKYNLDFFSNYFKIDKKELEYCFEYISFPLRNNEYEIIGYLRFIK